MKGILAIQPPPPGHWVGDGFPVRTLFSYNDLGRRLSPFLMLDHVAPYRFEPSEHLRGVGVHPHRGFETVSIIYQGEVEHGDSAGNSGRLGPGDVQWMTAASGILHKEFHSHEFARRGGVFEMVQLWVNLPARDKMAAPAYQDLRDAQFPRLPLGQAGSQLRLIAGEYAGARGPARTFTPINLWDVQMPAGNRETLAVPASHHAALVVLRGRVRLNDQQEAVAGQLVLFERSPDAFAVEALDDALLLVMSGEPIDEPVVGYGPFVMNTQAEIRQAMADFHAGRFGTLS